VAETTYGRKSPLVDRHLLHAFQLPYKHPATGTPLEIKIERPADLTPAIDALRKG